MKANVRIIVTAAAALAAVVLAVALVASPWDDHGRSGAISSGSAAIPQPSVDKLSKLTRSRIAPESRRVDLAIVSPRASDLFDALRSRNAAAGTADRGNPALDAFQTGEVPQRIYTEVNNALDSVNSALRARRARQGSLAGLDAAQASLDLQPALSAHAVAGPSRQTDLSGGIQASGRRMAAWSFQTSSESGS